MHPVSEVILASTSASLELVLMLGLGVILALPQLGLFSSPAHLRSLSGFVIRFGMPLFHIRNYSNVDFSLLSDLWILPVWATIQLIMLYLMGEFLFYPPCCPGLLHKEKRTSSTYRLVLGLCSTIGGPVLLPLMILKSLVSGNSSLFPAIVDAEMATAAVSLYFLPVPFFMFMFLEKRIGFLPKDDDSKKRKEEVVTDVSPVSGVSDEIQSEEKVNQEMVEFRFDVNVFETEETIEPELIQSDDSNPDAPCRSRFRCICVSIFRYGLSSFLNPVVVGVVIGIIIGNVPALKRFFFVSPPPVVGALKNFANYVANVTFGLGIIIAGVALGLALFSRFQAPDDPKFEQEAHLEVDENSEETIIESPSLCTKCWTGFISLIKPRFVHSVDLLRSIVTKLILVPLVVLGLASLFSYFIFPKIIANQDLRALAMTIIVVEASTPVFLIISMLLAVHGNGVQEFSETMFVQYLLSPITMLIFLIVGLYLGCGFHTCRLDSF